MKIIESKMVKKHVKARYRINAKNIPKEIKLYEKFPLCKCNVFVTLVLKPYFRLYVS